MGLTKDSCNISIGTGAGASRQGREAIAIGTGAGTEVQGDFALALGTGAGAAGQGACAIAIGPKTCVEQQHSHSIVLNASGRDIATTCDGALHIAPVHETESPHVLYYRPATGEIVSSANPLPLIDIKSATVLAGGMLDVELTDNQHHLLNLAPDPGARGPCGTSGGYHLETRQLWELSKQCPSAYRLPTQAPTQAPIPSAPFLCVVGPTSDACQVLGSLKGPTGPRARVLVVTLSGTRLTIDGVLLGDLRGHRGASGSHIPRKEFVRPLVRGPAGRPGPMGPPGPAGNPGRRISCYRVDPETGHISVVYDELAGDADDLGPFTGASGRDGTTLAAVEVVDGDIVTHVSNGTTTHVDLGPLQRSRAGVRGDAGPRGNHIVSCDTNGVGELTVGLSGGGVVNLGFVGGLRGPSGRDHVGQPGSRGQSGPQGYKGATINRVDGEVDGDTLVVKDRAWTLQNASTIHLGRASCPSSVDRVAVGTCGTLGTFDIMGDSTVAVGAYAGCTDQGIYSTALGAYSGKASLGARATAIGAYAGFKDVGPQTLCAGYSCTAGASGDGSVSIGALIPSNHRGGVVVGFGASSEAPDSIVVGYKAQSLAANCLVVGAGTCSVAGVENATYMGAVRCDDIAADLVHDPDTHEWLKVQSGLGDVRPLPDEYTVPVGTSRDVRPPREVAVGRMVLMSDAIAKALAAC